MSKENAVSPVPTSPVATQKLVANIGHDITEYDSVFFEAPTNATPEDIRRLAEQAVRDFVENDEEAFADSELGETNGLRITGIYDDQRRRQHKLHAEGSAPGTGIPLEPNYYEIGGAVQDGVKRLEQGVYTENQFILEALYAVYKNNPDPEDHLLSKAFIASYEEAAQEDTLRKIEMLADMHNQTVSDETGPIALTIKNAYGELANVIAQPPSVIGDGQCIFYAFTRDDGRTALVTHKDEQVKTIWDTGEVEVSPGPGEFFQSTGLSRVPVHRADVAMDIIENLRHLVPAEEASMLPNEQAAAFRVNGQTTRDTNGLRDD